MGDHHRWCGAMVALLLCAVVAAVGCWGLQKLQQPVGPVVVVVGVVVAAAKRRWEVVVVVVAAVVVAAAAV